MPGEGEINPSVHHGGAKTWSVAPAIIMVRKRIPCSITASGLTASPPLRQGEPSKIWRTDCLRSMQILSFENRAGIGSCRFFRRYRLDENLTALSSSWSPLSASPISTTDPFFVCMSRSLLHGPTGPDLSRLACRQTNPPRMASLSG